MTGPNGPKDDLRASAGPADTEVREPLVDAIARYPGHFLHRGTGRPDTVLLSPTTQQLLAGRVDGVGRAERPVSLPADFSSSCMR